MKIFFLITKRVKIQKKHNQKNTTIGLANCKQPAKP